MLPLNKVTYFSDRRSSLTLAVWCIHFSQPPLLPQRQAWGAVSRWAPTLGGPTLSKPGRRAQGRRTCSSSWHWP